jgi:hypothetical protein
MRPRLLALLLAAPLTALTALSGTASAVSFVDIGNGPNAVDGSYINAQDIAILLVLTELIAIADNSISIVDPVDLSTSILGPSVFGLKLQSATGVINVNHSVMMGAGDFQTLAPVVNLAATVADTGLVPLGGTRLSGIATQVNVTSTNASIQQGILFSSPLAPATISVASGSYNQNVDLDRPQPHQLAFENDVSLNGDLSINSGGFSAGGGTGNLTVDSLTLGSAAGGNAGHTQTGGSVAVHGTLALGNAASSTGTYDLQGGTLTAGTIDTVNAGSAAFSFTGGTLAVGTFIGDLANNGGILAPGASPGTTVVQGDYTQGATGALSIELGGTGAGSFDVLQVIGTATLAGDLDVAFWNGFSAAAGDSFDIVSATHLLGGFDTLNLATLDTGLLWDVAYLYDQDLAGTDYVRLSVQAVPEAHMCAMTLVGLGLVGMAARRRKASHVG